MAYCTTADIESLMGQTFSSTSRPTAQQVTDAIETTSAELDGVVQASGYTMPLSATAALSVMKRYTIFGAAVSAWHTGYVANDEPARVTYWREMYDGFITRLTSGEQGLPGETPGNPEQGTSFCAQTVRVDGYSAARRMTTGAVDGDIMLNEGCDPLLIE